MTPALQPTSNRLSPMQEQMWIGQQRWPDRPLSNMGHLYRLTGPIEPQRFIAAFDRVVARNEVLRTTVQANQGRPQVLVVDSAPVVTELLSMPTDATAVWADERITTPIDLQRCGYDSVLIRHADDDWTWWIDIHHVITDAWASALIFRQCADEYFGNVSETVEDNSSSREASVVERVRRAEEHWATLGAHQPCFGVGNTPSTRYPVVLSPEVASALRSRLATDLRALSPELALLAAWATAMSVWIARRTETKTIRFGVPIHHRRTPASKALVSPLMELFPVTVTVEPTMTFRELHRSALRSVLDMMRFAEPGTSPRQEFDAVINVITAVSGSFGAFPSVSTWVHSGHSDPHHPLRLQVSDFTGTGEPLIDLDVAHTIVGTPDREHLAAHLASAMRALADNPDQSVGAVDLLTDHEHLEVARFAGSSRFQPADVPVLATTPLIETIVEQLARRSDAVVMEEHGRAWTAAQLLADIDQVAASLPAHGVTSGSRVGVHLARSADAVVAILAVLRCGAAFVPLDPANPGIRHNQLVADAQPTFVIDQGNLATLRSGPLATAFQPSAQAALDDAAYVLFTSGSTGTPKGIEISNRGLSDYMAFAVASYVHTPNHGAPVVALASSLSFDLTITSLFLPFLTEGKLVVVPENGAAGMAAVAADKRLSWLKATPSHLEILVRLLPADHGLRTIVVGGEAFRRDLADRLLEVGREIQIFNEYGPTEAVVGCMIHHYNRSADRDAPGLDVPIGGPAARCEVELLDAHGFRVPVGVVGELHVARPGMANGYLHLQELSAERFVTHAFDRNHESTSVVLYRTGDLAILARNQAGSLELHYLGRNDDQLKVGGIRLEPADVEAAVKQDPSVRAAAVRLWSPAEHRPAAEQRCTRCGLGSSVPGISFDSSGLCSTCTAFDHVRQLAESWFGSTDDLLRIRDALRLRRTGKYDAIHLLSGGKDSTYALYRLVELGFEVYAFTLDNGFISDGAKDNIRKVVADLGIDHEFATTPNMNEIFRDSLERFSNVCQGCFKTIYTLSLNRAAELGIPAIITGLSRGQFFETRLTPEVFADPQYDPANIDRAVLAARRRYHRTDDAVNRLLDVSRFSDDSFFDEIQFVDFYRYEDVHLDHLLGYLSERAPWVRPADTGRSTNCLVNAAGIFVHRFERGFHNYAVPYSWDVKLAHKTRDEALEELDDPPAGDDVKQMLEEIGYEPRKRELLTAWYEADAELDHDVLRASVAATVPAHAVPVAFVRVSSLPTTANGKLDSAALPAPTRVHRSDDAHYVAPEDEIEELVCEIWSAVLSVTRVGAADDFFELGGSSLLALEMVVRVSEAFGVTVPGEQAFACRTPREMAAVVTSTLLAELETADATSSDSQEYGN
jgi:amino acid adenylation domain-containing protein